MYHLGQANVHLGVDVPQVGNPALNRTGVENTNTADYL